MKATGLISLLSDFGVVDHYVGQMKAALYAANPAITVIDLCHDIPPHNLQWAAHVVAGSIPFYPSGTVFLCVIDPGVGTSRSLLYLETDHHLFVAPDNGVLTAVVEDAPSWHAFHVTDAPGSREGLGNTFDGRDIMAPIAAAVAGGAQPSSFGTPIDTPELLALSRPRREATKLVGEVLHVDHFGNIITNIRAQDVKELGLPEPPHTLCTIKTTRHETRGLVRTYADVTAGSTLALINSLGFIELATNAGRGVDVWQAVPGEQVNVCAEVDQ